MNNFCKSINKMYEYRNKTIILALTGRTGSGCTTVSRILAKDTFDNLDLKTPKTYDYLDAEERKQEIIYKYMENNHWRAFNIIEGSAIILSFVFEKGYDKLLEFLKDNDSNGKCKIDNISEIEEELEKIKVVFTECQEYSLSGENIQLSLNNKNNEYFMFYLQKLPEYKKMMQDILSKHVCYPNVEGDTKAQLYTYLMQTWGNNIRSSGDPYITKFSQENYYDIAIRIDNVINIIRCHSGQNGETRICIDALRNPYEVIYFKDNYKNFYLISISTEEKYRKNRLSFLSKKEQESLEITENPIKFNKTEEQFFHQNVQACVEISDIHLYNPDVDNHKFYFLTQQIIKYITLILHPGLVTPTHMERCMQLAYNAKFNSGCLSRQVGAVITGSDFSIRAVGWNDVPKGQVPCNLRGVNEYCANKDCESFSNFELCDADFDESMQKIKKNIVSDDLGGRIFSYCFKDVYNGYKGTSNQVLTRSLHAEENAFLQISKYGGSGIQGGFLFTTASPCELCAKKAYQLGITNIYYIDPYPGISMNHILSFGKHGNPKMNLFYGAIGNAYIALYEPRMAYKDELELVTGIQVKNIVKKEKQGQESEPIVSDIKYITMDITFIYSSKKNIQTLRNMELEVTGEPINHIEKEIIWTGSQYKSTILADDNGEFTIEDSTRQVSPYKYRVLFNKNVMKGERVAYSLITDVSDENEQMRPFLSHTVKNPTDKLVLTIKFPTDKINNVEMQIYRDSEREIKMGKPKKLEKRTEGKFEIYTYTINKPELLNTYCIQWDLLHHIDKMK